MKTKADAVKGWLRKAESDLANIRICLQSNEALDTACFHAQQAAEKYLKAYLLAMDIEFPFIHNLEKLIELCAKHDSSFLQIKQMGESLTPYAVSLRYDEEFWPDKDTTEEALHLTEAIKEFVLARLPDDMKI
ncbi:MAG: HEPN domain-containing protein [Armatimonadota bacterium]